MVNVFDKDSNDDKTFYFYFYSLKEEKEYWGFDKTSGDKKETLRLRHTHKDTIYILLKERIQSMTGKEQETGGLFRSCIGVRILRDWK